MCSGNDIKSESRNPLSEVDTLSVKSLAAEITQLAAHINAATCQWLLLVGEFDRRGGWAEWDCRSCAHWLSYRCGLSPAAGREQARVARALAELPAIRAAFARGELCYSQVRALTRIASPETEDDLIMIARHATAGQLEVIVRAYRGVLASRQPEHRRRFVRCVHDYDGSLLIQACLPAEEGAVFIAALEAGRDATRGGQVPGPGGSDDESAGRRPAHDESAPIGNSSSPAGNASAEATQIGDSEVDPDRADAEQAACARASVSNADALVLMAETLLASGPAERNGGDGYQVVVHVDAAALAAPRSDNQRGDEGDRRDRRDDDHQDRRDDDHSHHQANDQGSCQLDQGPAYTPRRLAGSPATRALSASSNATVGRCRSAVGRGPFHPRSDERSRHEMRSAVSPAARNAASFTPITSAIGHMAGPPTSQI